MSDTWTEAYIASKPISGPVNGSHIVVEHVDDHWDLVARDEDFVYVRWTFATEESAVLALDRWPQYPAEADSVEYFEIEMENRP